MNELKEMDLDELNYLWQVILIPNLDEHCDAETADLIDELFNRLNKR